MALFRRPEFSKFAQRSNSGGLPKLLHSQGGSCTHKTNRFELFRFASLRTWPYFMEVVRIELTAESVQAILVPLNIHPHVTSIQLSKTFS